MNIDCAVVQWLRHHGDVGGRDAAGYQPKRRSRVFIKRCEIDGRGYRVGVWIDNR